LATPDVDAVWSEIESRSRRAEGTRDERRAFEIASFPNVEAVEALIEREDSATVEYLMALCEAAPSDELLGVMAADFVYSLLYQHADTFLEDIDRAARGHPRFRSALAAAFLGWSDLSPRVRERLEKYV